MLKTSLQSKDLSEITLYTENNSNLLFTYMFECMKSKNINIKVAAYSVSIKYRNLLFFALMQHQFHTYLFV